MFFKEVTIIISLKELRKRKAKKFFNKENLCFWIDNDGRFYFANKHSFPTKQQIQEYALLKDNKNAVLVRWGKDYGRKTAWFEDFNTFETIFKAERAAMPAVMGDLTYFIIKTGYPKTNPIDRKVIYELPKFDVLHILEDDKRMYANINYAYRHTARIWCKEAFGEEYFDYEEIVEHLIREFEKTKEVEYARS